MGLFCSLGAHTFPNKLPCFGLYRVPICILLWLARSLIRSARVVTVTYIGGMHANNPDGAEIGCFRYLTTKSFIFIPRNPFIAVQRTGMVVARRRGLWTKSKRTFAAAAANDPHHNATVPPRLSPHYNRTRIRSIPRGKPL